MHYKHRDPFMCKYLAFDFFENLLIPPMFIWKLRLRPSQNFGFGRSLDGSFLCKYSGSGVLAVTELSGCFYPPPCLYLKWPCGSWWAESTKPISCLIEYSCSLAPRFGQHHAPPTVGQLRPCRPPSVTRHPLQLPHVYTHTFPRKQLKWRHRWQCFWSYQNSAFSRAPLHPFLRGGGATYRPSETMSFTL